MSELMPPPLGAHVTIIQCPILVYVKREKEFFSAWAKDVGEEAQKIGEYESFPVAVSEAREWSKRRWS